MNKGLFTGKMNEIIEQALADMARKEGNIIREAFREHFGYDITEIEDPEELEHIVMAGDPVESYRYRGQTFLYYERGEIEIDPFLEKPEWPTIKVTHRYVKV